MSADKIEEIRARHKRDNRYGDGLYPGAHKDRATLLAEVERLHRAHQAACEGGDLLRAALLAEVERMRAEKEALYASIVGIERAAAGAIYSQESIHAMALYALKSLEVKP